MTWRVSCSIVSQISSRSSAVVQSFLLTVLSLWLRLLLGVVLPAGLDPETLAVLWTMVDRHEPESPHAPFWAALPPHFGTGGADNSLNKSLLRLGVVSTDPRPCIACALIDNPPPPHIHDVWCVPRRAVCPSSAGGCVEERAPARRG